MPFSSRSIKHKHARIPCSENSESQSPQNQRKQSRAPKAKTESSETKPSEITVHLISRSRKHNKMKVHNVKMHIKAEKQNLRDNQNQKTKSRGAQIPKS